MSIYLNQLRSMVEAITIVSSSQLQWYGRLMSTDTARGLSEHRLAPGISSFKDSLQSHLYQSFYCTGGPTPWPLSSSYGNEPDNFREQLSSSNSVSQLWSDGWKVWQAAQNGNVGVAYGEFQCWAPQSDVEAEQESLIAAGHRVRVRLPAERLKTFPGFYGIFGGKDLVSGESVRFYWNLERDGAPILIRELSVSLAAAKLAYQLKVVSNPSGYSRCDAGVLYIFQPDFSDAADSVRHAYPMVRSQLKPQVPALTRRLAPGLGFAENPGANTSFGFHRCGLIAEGLIDSRQRGITSVPGRMDVIAERFAREGLSLDRPYLNSNSDDYPDLDIGGDSVAG